MTEKALFFIHAQTGLHPGSGTALGTVDLPVQRERHTNWPVIPASSLKGVLRDACCEKTRNKYQGNRKKANEEDINITTVFGPTKIEADTSHAGALAITDARILAFPVRSFKGVFAWITCSAVLERLNRDLKFAGIKLVEQVPHPDKDKAACVQGSPLFIEEDKMVPEEVIEKDKMVLEEFEFERSGDAAAVAEWIAEKAVEDPATRNRIKKHLVVLHDDDFTYFVRHATEVVARIGLDYERKTVKSGALFYQEFIPPETIFYSLILAEESRHNGEKRNAAEVLKYVRESIPNVIQIGGDETIGKGLCAVRFESGKEA